MLGLSTPDDELWKLMKDGCTQAFELLVERYWEAVYTTAFSYLKDRESATEIANDTFLNIWQKKHYLNITSFKSYLTASSRYHVYKVLKARHANKLTYVDDYEKLHGLMKVENYGEQKIRYLNLQTDMENLLNNLPKRCREIFIMSRLGNLTNAEIADKLSISKRTVENQIAIAQKFVLQNSKYIALISLLALLINL